ENPLDYECVIVDEMSMVDILLMDGLLAALKPETRLILVGDSDQLPPVGAGNVLKDMLSCGNIFSVRLTDIFRQAEESLIVVNAHLINKGEYPSYNEKDKDFFLMERRSEQDILDTIKELCRKRIPDYIREEGSESIQVLTPMKKGLLGSIELNKALQEVLNPPEEGKSEKAYGGRIYRTGDRVMQNRNDYDLEYKSLSDFETRHGVFNGDLGVIKNVDNDAGTVSVLFDNERMVVYDYSNLDELETAFAMTVHKSQGSEFPVVIMPLTRFPAVLATRNLLYTALTRAKTLVVLVGVPQVVCAMVDNNELRKRNSALAYRLERLWGFDDEEEN
ncbi:MAG: AAA family ATPase, partial [Firmicutes bacterium]|nr:AAA family ATPase [Bacillota bacterium]